MTDIPEGYKSLSGISPAEDHIGPFYYKKTEQGPSLGFRAEPHNCNGIDTVHGGVLMAFADYAVTMLALSGVRENCTSISFNSDFIAAARLGDWVEGRGEVVRRAGSMTFVSGQLFSDDTVVLTFQSVVRRLKKSGQ